MAAAGKLRISGFGIQELCPRGFSPLWVYSFTFSLCMVLSDDEEAERFEGLLRAAEGGAGARSRTIRLSFDLVYGCLSFGCCLALCVAGVVTASERLP